MRAFIKRKKRLCQQVLEKKYHSQSGVDVFQYIIKLEWSSSTDQSTSMRGIGTSDMVKESPVQRIDSFRLLQERTASLNISSGTKTVDESFSGTVAVQGTGAEFQRAVLCRKPAKYYTSKIAPRVIKKGYKKTNSVARLPGLPAIPCFWKSFFSYHI